MAMPSGTSWAMTPSAAKHPQVVTDLEAGADNHPSMTECSPMPTKATNPSGADETAVVMAVGNLKIDVVLFFMAGMNQQMMLKEIEEDEGQQDKDGAPACQLHRLRNDMEDPDAEQNPGREGDQNGRITPAPILPGQDQRHAGESRCARETSNKEYELPLFRHCMLSKMNRCRSIRSKFVKGKRPVSFP